MTSTPRPPHDFQPRRLGRWALAIPFAILAYTLWQLLLARLFFDGAFQGGLTWVEGTAEAVSILVAAFVAPARKRALALAALAFYMVRNLAVLLFAPNAASPAGGAMTIALAMTGTAIVFALTKPAKT